MDRLRDQIGQTDPDVALAADLLRSRARAEASPAMRARVRAAVTMRRAHGASWLLKPATALAVFVAIVSGASAHYGSAWVRRVMPSWPFSAPATPEKSRAARSNVAPIVPVAAPIAPVVAAPETTAPIAPPRVAKHRASAGDAALVGAAFRALRRDEDPAAAVQLLAEYRAQQPAGPLAEPALALLIEAESQLGDARAVTHAAEYLARFPSGAFANSARELQAR
jgi:hypothetical protein